jgi:WYL domain
MEADSVGERLVRAVQDHRVVELVYHGHARTVEPHMVALHGAGEPVLFAYQTHGTSGGGDVPGWRTFIVSEIESVEATEQRFPGPRGDFDPSAAELVEVFARA